MSKKTQKHISLLNTLGGGAYIGSTLQWLMVMVVFLPAILSSPLFQIFLPQSTEPKPEPIALNPPPVVTDPGPLWPVISWVAIAVGIFVVLLAAYVMLVRVPKAISKTGQTITHTPAKLIVPVAAKQLHLKKRQKIQLADGIVLGIKLLVTALPFIIFYVGGSSLKPEIFTAMLFVVSVLFAWSVTLFIVQYILARVFGVAYQQVR